MLYRLGNLVAAHPVIVLVLWIALAAGVTLTVKQVGADTDNNVSLPGTGSQAATDLLQAGFPPQQNGSNPIIFHIRGAGKVTDKDNKQAITDSYKAIKKIKFVHSATSPFAQGAGAPMTSPSSRHSGCWTPPNPARRPAWRWSAAARSAARCRQTTRPPAM
jgi:uncharacterized membrane protein YdfJ with MMPL/SSD domain